MLGSARIPLRQVRRGLSKLSLLSNYRVGNVYSGWEVLESREVPEFNLEAIRLRHKKIGSEMIHLGNSEDDNKGFSVGFRTVPQDSTGVAHILEHNILCGSSEYPVRDPFFKMINRSLSTFMNAMTGLDYTFYPFSSRNDKDYYNLLSVYISSVFRPLLRLQDFRQEGWRLENSDPRDSSTPLEIKGVVFNEMKGVYADSQQRLFRELLNTLLPDGAYGHCSGGIPEKIPSLTWEGLKAFYEAHYCPANAKFFSYGDLDLAKHLEILNGHLKNLRAGSKVEKVGSHKRWSQSKKKTITCAEDPLNSGSTLAFAYSMCDASDSYEAFALNILSELLTDGPNSPFYKALLEPQLGTGFAPSTGYVSDVKDTIFSIGIQGMDPSKEKVVVDAIQKTFHKVAEEGFDPRRVDAILHRIELSLKLKSANFGINLIMSLTSFWNQSDDPLGALDLNKKIEKLRSKLCEDPKYFQDLVRHYFINNPHHVIMTMNQKDTFVEEQKKIFEDLQSNLTKDLEQKNRKKLFELGKELAEAQNANEDISCLPTLQVEEILDNSLSFKSEKVAQNIEISVQPTNGIAYFRSLIGTHNLRPDLMEYFPIFLSVITKLGAGSYDYRQFNTEIELATGGLGISYHLSENPSNLSVFTEGLLLESYCLERNADRMFDLWLMVFNQLKYDPNRIKTLLQMTATNAVNNIVYSGHSYAMSHASRKLSQASLLRESFGGLESIRSMKKMSENLDIDLLIHKLREIAESLFTKSNMKSILHTTPCHADSFSNSTQRFLDNVRGQPSLPSEKTFDINYTPENSHTYVSTPFPVNYASKTIMTGVSFNHSDFPALNVLARLATFKFLHTEIREKGGAYGGGSKMSSDGVFYFYSYRDPNSDKTVKTFDKTGDFVKSNDLINQTVNESILGVFQKVDAPFTPDKRCLRKFLNGVTDDEFDSFRRAVKRVSKEDILRVADKYLKNESLVKGVTIIGPESGSKDRNNWNVENL